MILHDWESWYPGRFEIEYDRDEADYVYEGEKLATLSGKKMHGKKNHVNRFRKEFEGRWSYEIHEKRESGGMFPDGFEVEKREWL